MFVLIYYYIYVYYYIIYYYIFISIYYYIIIIYIVMCPKNGTIFMLRVPKWDFCLAYVYIDNDIDLVESIPWWGIFYLWWIFRNELFLYFKDRVFCIDTVRGILWYMTLI